MRGPEASELKRAPTRSPTGVVWVDDFVPYLAVEWHTCAGLAGGCLCAAAACQCLAAAKVLIERWME